MKDDQKKVIEEDVEETVVEEKLTEEELDKASGGSGHADDPIVDYDFHYGPIIGPDGRLYPRLIWPDSDDD